MRGSGWVTQLFMGRLQRRELRKARGAAAPQLADLPPNPPGPLVDPWPRSRNLPCVQTAQREAESTGSPQGKLLGPWAPSAHSLLRAARWPLPGPARPPRPASRQPRWSSGPSTAPGPPSLLGTHGSEDTEPELGRQPEAPGRPGRGGPHAHCRADAAAGGQGAEVSCVPSAQPWPSAA